MNARVIQIEGFKDSRCNDSKMRRFKDATIQRSNDSKMQRFKLQFHSISPTRAYAENFIRSDTEPDTIEVAVVE